MPLGVLTIDVHLPYAESLKDKRRVIKSLKDRLRSQFNVSVAELEGDQLWQRAVVGVAAIAADREYLTGLLQRVGDAALGMLRGQEAMLGDIEIFD
jgi:uncharacterized protein YlxP (DUF503 family)